MQLIGYNQTVAACKGWPKANGCDRQLITCVM